MNSWGIRLVLRHRFARNSGPGTLAFTVVMLAVAGLLVAIISTFGVVLLITAVTR